MTHHSHDPADEAMDPAVLDRLLEAIAPEAPPPGLRAKVLGRVRAHAQTPAFTTVDSESGWRQLMPGVTYKMLVFDTVAGTKSFLLRAQAGIRMPSHDHHGYEECLVIAGEFCFGELRLRAGDFHGAPAGTKHPEAHTTTGVTVYLRASIEDYPGIRPLDCIA